MSECIRIAVIDDHPLFREGVIHTLLRARDMAVVGEGATAADAVRIAESDSPDIILLDVSMPGGGIEAAREIRKSCASVKAVILTASENERHVADALQSGVNGYILKGSSGAELLQIIRAVQNAEFYITPALAARLLGQTKQATVDTGSPIHADTMTYREEQVLRLLSQGLMNKEIAHKLGLTEKTVKYYMTGVMQKLNARNRVEAVLKASRLVEAPDPVFDAGARTCRTIAMSHHRPTGSVSGRAFG
jgi:DNA-binding NarL/FixJ family response regulator